MKNYTAYSKGHYAGRHGFDTRSCPYESTALILDWMEGYEIGRKEASVEVDSAV